MTPRHFYSLQIYFEFREGMFTVNVVLAIDPVPVFWCFRALVVDVLEIRKENRDLQRLDACHTPLRETYIVVHARGAFKGTALNTGVFRQSATHNTAQSTCGAFQSYIQDVVRVLVLVIGSVTSRLLKKSVENNELILPTRAIFGRRTVADGTVLS